MNSNILTAIIAGTSTLIGGNALGRPLNATPAATWISPAVPFERYCAIKTGSVTEVPKSADHNSDSTCRCQPSLPVEILGSSIVWGFPAYWGYRAFFDDTSDFAPEIGLVGVALFLPLISLAPAAKWTSDCDANWWHSVWIGFASDAACALAYGIIYGNHHGLNYYRFNWPEYLALGVAPAVIATFAYNHFLHPKSNATDESDDEDQGMYLLPAITGSRSMSLSFGMRF